MKYIKKYEEFLDEGLFDILIPGKKEKAMQDWRESRKTDAEKKADAKEAAAEEKAKRKKLINDLKYLIRTKKKENIILALQVATNEDISFNIKFAKIFENIDLSKMDLRGLDFGKINMKGANFSGSDLKNAVFIDTILEGANFTGANIEEATFRIKSPNFRNINFTDANLYKSKIKVGTRECNFTNAFMAEAILDHSAFVNCTFEKADLTNASVYSTQFTDCSFKDASLHSIDNMDKVRSIAGCDFTGAQYLADDFKGLAKTKLKTAKNLDFNK